MSILLHAYVSIRILNIFIAVLLIYVLLKRYYETRITPLLLLLIVFIGLAVVNVNLLSPIYFGVDMRIAAHIHTLLMIGGFGFIILFFSSFAGETSPLRFSFITGTVISIIVVVIAAIFYDFEILGFVYTNGAMQSFIWAAIPSSIFIVTIFGTAALSYVDLIKSEQNVLNDEQKIQIQRMKLGLVYALMVGQLIIIPGYIFGLLGFLELSIWLAMTIGWIPTMIGFFIITFAYTGKKQVGFLLPQKIDGLLVIDQSGLPLFQYEFDEGALKREVALISGAITAVKSLMNEAFGVSGEIQRIEFQDRHVLLNITPEFSAILITERPTSFLHRSLRAFSISFKTEYGDRLVNFNGQSSVFDKAYELVDNSFGIHGHSSQSQS